MAETLYFIALYMFGFDIADIPSLSDHPGANKLFDGLKMRQVKLRYTVVKNDNKWLISN
jgi:hypothetical protein